MRAIVMQDGKLSVAEIEEPTPGPGEVLVKVLACGICGSDMSCAAHGEKFNEASVASFGQEMLDLSQPVVFGHEFVGEILAHGPDTQATLPVGTRVVSMPMLVRESPVLVGFSGAEVPGGYAERMVLSEPLLVPVPDGLSTDVAALTEPMTVALHALNRVETASNDVPLVVGCGPIGLAIVVLLKARGAGPIVVSDLSAERREFALRLGADVAIDPTTDSPYEAVMAAAATDDPALMASPTALAGQLPLRPTIGFECTGASGLIQQMIGGMPPGSRVAVAGISFSSEKIEPSVAVLKEVDLRFSLFYNGDEFAEVVRLLAAGEIDVEGFITGKVGLDGVVDAFTELATSPTDAKVLIDPSLS